MKRLRRVLYALFALCLFFPNVLSASAKEEEYTYTIRIFSGRQGSFADGDVIVFEGRHYGDRVNFYQSAVTLNDNSKYYIRGIRESGKDNNVSMQTSSFLVTGDRDYVIAYGILGNATSYTINYVDSEGNTLAPSETYYGNVGDKPVVAYLYIDGWQPQAYNITKTLEKDPLENVFNFVYTRITEPQQPAPEPEPGPEPEEPGPEPEGPGPEAPVEGGGVVVVPAPEEEPEAPAPDDGGAPDDGDAADDADAPDDGGAPDDGDTPDDADGGEENIPDDETPLGAPNELENLDENPVPTSNFLTVAADARLLGIPLPVVLALVLVAVGTGWYFLIFRKRKKKEEESEA